MIDSERRTDVISFGVNDLFIDPVKAARLVDSWIEHYETRGQIVDWLAVEDALTFLARGSLAAGPPTWSPPAYPVVQQATAPCLALGCERPSASGSVFCADRHAYPAECAAPNCRRPRHVGLFCVAHDTPSQLLPQRADSVNPQRWTT
jgi:hypothetical protein